MKNEKVEEDTLADIGFTEEYRVLIKQECGKRLSKIKQALKKCAYDAPSLQLRSTYASMQELEVNIIDLQDFIQTELDTMEMSMKAMDEFSKEVARLIHEKETK